MKKRNNMFLYIVFVVATVIIITVFILFFNVFSKIDKRIYDVNIGSIAFDDNFNYIKTEGTSQISQKLDGMYYIFEEKEGKQYKYKVGNQAIIYNASDNNLLLYGKAYQVMNDGSVVTVEGETKIPKLGNTKFYKLADRKYLIVDREINSVNDNVVKTKEYLIVELDKQGNAIFANNEISFKAIKPIVLATSGIKFDVANEKLIIQEDEIDLKNIIGSTNEYKEEPPKVEDDNNNNTEEENYYDKYLTEVVRSVNNLANGVSDLNTKSESVSIDSGQKYYDITKWIALRGVTKDTTTITLDYYVFDPANEYQAVFFEIEDKNGVKKKIYVNKDGTSTVIRDLVPNSEYRITFGYQLINVAEESYVDDVKVKTEKPNYEIKVDKLIVKNDESDPEKKNYEVYFTLNIDKKYVFNQARIHFYTDNILKDEKIVLCTKRMDTCDAYVDDDIYHGMIVLPSLGIENKITFENVEVCNSEGICSISEVNAFYKFFSE